MTGSADQTVFIVDDDPAVRDSLALLLGLRGYRTAVFASAEDFLATCRPDWRGCLVLDIRMPGMSGLELQEKLRAAGHALPVVVVTAHGDVASARAAFKAEAADFLEKPVDDDQLMAAIENALARQADRGEATRARGEARERLGGLTARERQVMELIAAGRHNREVAQALGISPRTVEVYKARMMEKLHTRNLSELIRLVIDARGG